MKLDKRKKVENIDFHHFFDFDKLKSFDRFNKSEVEPVRRTLTVSQLVCDLDTWKTALTIFLLLCMKLGHYKGVKLTETGTLKII